MESIVVLEKSKCFPKRCNYICMRFCPRNRVGEKCIQEDGDIVKIDEKLCIACGICVKKCPFNALKVSHKPSILKKPPVHQYGTNGFRLFTLPIPKKDMTIGILGSNGIGKTTALNILSGNILPNLGKESATQKEILDYFKGKETWNFFQDMFNRKIKVSYKPQYIEKIPKMFKGKVKDLLSKIGDYSKVAEELNITKILDSDISKISGGELQRVAIAATILKKSNVTFFDEPSSYLDIKQRLIVARKIKSLPGTTFVVEHDLIMLDYMTDLIYIFYGEEGVYGISSNPYTSKEGINNFLRGYLPSERIKFREKPITFEKNTIDSVQEREINIEWGQISKKFERFSLKVNEGYLRESEIVGVIGQNGIGKSTFAKLLSGELEPDKGEISSELTISYKPQYIGTESDELVKEIILSNPLYPAFKSYFRKLRIEDLLNRRLSELSGGELQRVAIVSTLTKDKDLYLLDEPSAHLDVEQRIAVAKTIKDLIRVKKKTAIVIDHDLMFIDYISERIMVFKGEPAVFGESFGPLPKRDAMNLFLRDLNITFRRDETSNRPRPNKEGSVKDREQKSKGEFYY